MASNLLGYPPPKTQQIYNMNIIPLITNNDIARVVHKKLEKNLLM